MLLSEDKLVHSNDKKSGEFNELEGILRNCSRVKGNLKGMAKIWGTGKGRKTPTT